MLCHYEYEPTLQGYYFLDDIGHGTFGVVKRAHDLVTGKEVAIKIMRRDVDSSRIAEREVAIMRGLHHKHIIRLLEVRHKRKHVFLVMEFADKGTLSDYVQHQGGLGEEETRFLFRQILSAITYCHSRWVAHRDLKLSNILLDGQMNTKLADFGLSAHLEQGELVTGFCGTPEYCAPELFLSKPYDAYKADLWSMGVILYTMLTASTPFYGDDNSEILASIYDDSFTLPQFTTGPLQELLSCLLSLDPDKRPTANNACKHWWFTHCQVTSQEDEETQVQPMGTPQDPEARRYLLGLGLLPDNHATAPGPRGLEKISEISEPNTGENTGSRSISVQARLEESHSSSKPQDPIQEARAECSPPGAQALVGPKGLQEPVPRARPEVNIANLLLLHLLEEKEGEEDEKECDSLCLNWTPKTIPVGLPCIPSARSEAQSTTREPQQSGSKSACTTTADAAATIISATGTSKPAATNTADAATNTSKPMATTAADAATITSKPTGTKTADATTNTNKPTVTTSAATTSNTKPTATATADAATNSNKPMAKIAAVTTSNTKPTVITTTAAASSTTTATTTTVIATTATTTKSSATATAAIATTSTKSDTITTTTTTTTNSSTTSTAKSTAKTTIATATTTKSSATAIAALAATSTKPDTITTTTTATTNKSTTNTAKSTAKTTIATATTTRAATAAAVATTSAVASARTTSAATTSTGATAATATAAPANAATRRKLGQRGLCSRIANFFLRACCIKPAPRRSAGPRNRKVAPQESEGQPRP